MDRKYFYDSIRASLFGGKLSVSQVQGMEGILNEWDKRQLKDKRWLAYIFATIFHETARTMQPIEEYGKGKGHDYGKKLKRSRVPYVLPDKIYYGRGFVQLTWYENYELMGRLLCVPLLEHPELALDINIATAILFEGMTRGSSSVGDFTGKCLEMYFNEHTEDWVNARKIINGLDQAVTIAERAKKFNLAIK